MNKSEQLNERIMEALRQKAKQDAAAIVEALFPKKEETMTEEDLKQIDALLAETTEGRWLAVELCEGAPTTNVVSEDRTCVASCENEGDAAFIAQAPLIVERLVCALRASWAREDAFIAEREAMKP